MTFAEATKAVFESHGRADYQTGLDAIASCRTSNPDEVSDLIYWRMCLLSRLDRVDEACAQLRSSLDKGMWWGKKSFDDPDFENMRSVPDWQGLVAMSLDRANAATSVVGLPIDCSPAGTTRATLVMLHGAAERPAMIIDRYGSALHHGCRLLALHGTEPFASGRFGWPLDGAESAQCISWAGITDR